MTHTQTQAAAFQTQAWRDPSTTFLGKTFSGCLWGRSASLNHQADIVKKLGSWGVLKCKGNLSGLRMFFYLGPFGHLHYFRFGVYEKYVVGISKKTVQDLLLAGHQPFVVPLSNFEVLPCRWSLDRLCVPRGAAVSVMNSVHIVGDVSDSTWKSDRFDLLLLSLGSHPPASQILMQCQVG